jgi:uncharacterized peroxidase-related enzyme
MTFIRTVPREDATGDVLEMYESDERRFGYLPNYTSAFSLRPNVMDAWSGLVVAVRGNMDRRRYELATVAAALALENSYCSLAHGSVLRDKFYARDDLVAIARDYRAANLPPAEVAIMAYAEKVALRAREVTQQDIDELRGHGLSDQDIFDIATAAAARCFFAKMLDAVGALPDGAYMQLEAEVRDALTVGRSIAGDGDGDGAKSGQGCDGNAGGSS